MPLRFDLGPFEKLFIGKSVLTNNSNRAMFVIEGETPILRARDVLGPEQTKVLEKLYRCIQQMYLEEDHQRYQRSYSALRDQANSECPARRADLRFIDQLIKGGDHYKALRSLKKFISQEAFSFVDSGALV